MSLLCCISHRKGSPLIETLTYGDGKIRTYRPDNIDGRLEGTKTIENREEIISHLAASEDHILIPVTRAKVLFGWKDEEFDKGD